MATATLNGAAIGDEAAFHAACQAELGFPPGYGATIDAWVDCLSYLRDDENMTRFKLKPNEVLEIVITEASKMPGLDGQKMSKSYGNTIFLREDPESITKKIRTMQTDPQRVRRTDPGDPDKCPVWQLHQVYSGDDVKQWVQAGCRSAGIGCIECKKKGTIDRLVIGTYRSMFNRHSATN